jgi:hypothetical protein
VQADPYPLLFHARDRVTDPIQDTLEQRVKGWHRTVLFANYFRPASLQIVDFWSMVQQASQAPDRSKSAYFGLYPFQWETGWSRAFQQLQANGQLKVAPILQTLVLNRGRTAVKQWLQRIQHWNCS